MPRNVSLTAEAVNMESNNNVAAKYFQGRTNSFKFNDNLEFHTKRGSYNDGSAPNLFPLECNRF